MPIPTMLNIKMFVVLEIGANKNNKNLNAGSNKACVA
jgi:hypothetical protein